MQDKEEGAFICPECGSTEAGSQAMVSPLFDAGDPWSSVLQIIACAKCDFIIPAHLGERWDQISIEEAQQSWKNDYRDTAEKSSDYEEAEEE